jgi:type III restriction enzyme
MRLALKLATGAGKTTVMAMLIAWQTINAVRRPNSNKFTRGFLIVAPGLTIRDRLEIRFPRVQRYRVELPEERLTAEFNDDSVLELTPDLIAPSITRNAGIIGEDVELSLEHLEDMRRSTLLFHVTQRLLYTKWRDPGEEPKLHLFGQLKRITKQWLDTYLVCTGGTYPA